MFKFGVVGLVAVLALSLGGCPGPVRKYPAHVPESQLDVGTTTVAVVMIEPWQNVVGDLKPNFTMNGDAAVAKVLPITSIAQDQILDAFGAGLSLGLPSSTVTQTEQVVKPADGPRTTDEKTVTRETKPGEAPDLEVDPVDGRTAAALPGINLGASLLEEPPILQYQAALALFQEVKLLNRYVDSAALAHGMVPYLVRLQIGVTPYASREPFDVYSRIGIFSRLDAKLLADACSTVRQDYRSECERLAKRPPEIIPLVVTDDLEATRQSRAVDVVRQLALNLAGTVQNVGVDAQLQKLNEQLQAINGTKLNSLSSVTRLNDNTIQARFGAASDPSIDPCRGFGERACRSYDRSMVNRNYFVTLLLLVPSQVALYDPPPPLDLIVETKLRDIVTGEVLPALGETDFEHYANEELGRFRGQVETSYVPKTTDDWLELLANVTRGDAQAVRKTLGWENKTEDFDETVFQAMWVRLAAIAASVDLHAAQVDLPIYRAPRLPEAQLVMALDDGDASTRVRLVGGWGLDPSSLTAHLQVNPSAPLAGTEKPRGGYIIPSETMTAGARGSDVLVTFPSLIKIGFQPDPKGTVELVMEWRDNDRFRTNLLGLASPGREISGDGYTTTKLSAFAPSGTLENEAATQRSVKAAADATERTVCAANAVICHYTAILRATKAEIDAGFTISPIVNRIMAQDAKGEASFVVTFKKGDSPASTATVAVVNARLLGATVDGNLSASYLSQKNAVALTGQPGGSARITLQLDQLAEGETVRVRASGERAGKKLGDLPPLELTVKKGEVRSTKP